MRFAPQFEWCGVVRAEALWRTNDVATAEQILRWAIQRYPAQHEPLRADAKGILAELLSLRKETAAQAVGLARDALSVRGDRATTLVALARACEATGDAACVKDASARLLKLPHLPDALRERTFVVLGSTLKNELFGASNALGARLRTGSLQFRVIGVLAPKGQFLGIDLDDTAFIPTARAMELFNKEGLTEIHVMYAEGTGASGVAEGVRKMLTTRHGREDFTVTTQEDMLRTLGNILDILTMAVGALGSISLLVGGVGIVTIMTIAVAERTGEVGLMLALGALPAGAQTVIGAKSGVINWVEGDVFLGDKPYVMQPSQFGEVKETMVFRTEEGRAEILQKIRQEGPLSSSSLEYPGLIDWPWAPSSISRALLENLYFQGDLVIFNKQKTRKIYDLAEKHIPENLVFIF